MLTPLLGGSPSLIKVASTNSGYLLKHEQLPTPTEEISVPINYPEALSEKWSLLHT